MSGKGDAQRPASVSDATMAERWPMQRVEAPAGSIYVVGKGWMNACRHCPAGWNCVCGLSDRDQFRITIRYY